MEHTLNQLSLNKEPIMKWFQFSYLIILTKSDTVHKYIPPLRRFIGHPFSIPLTCLI